MIFLSRFLQKLDCWYHKSGEPWFGAIFCDLWDLEGGASLRSVMTWRLRRIFRR